MLKKRNANGKAEVTFVLPPDVQADHVHVTGDFNDWQASTPMKRQKDGSWKVTVPLEQGREYQFRYVINGDHWVNDPQADAYAPNPFGSENSVVRTEAGSSAGASPRAGGSRKASGGAAGAKSAGGTRRSAGAAATPGSASPRPAAAGKTSAASKGTGTGRSAGRSAAGGANPASAGEAASGSASAAGPAPGGRGARRAAEPAAGQGAETPRTRRPSEST